MELEGLNRLCSHVWLLGAPLSPWGPLAGVGVFSFLIQGLTSKKQDKEVVKTKLGTGMMSFLPRLVAQSKVQVSWSTRGNEKYPSGPGKQHVPPEVHD